MKPTRVRHLVLAALLVVTAVNYAQRNAISPAATTIQTSLGVTGPDVDDVIAAFFLAYTVFQIPSGRLLQAWQPRVTLSLLAAAWSLALVGCALATGLTGLYAGRLVMGALQAGIFPCATVILAAWYPASRRGLSTALLNTFMILGGAAGTALTGKLLEPFGWRWIFALYALPGLLWAAWFYWWFRDRPGEHPGVNEAERELLALDQPPPAAEPGGRVATNWLVLLSLPVILLCTQQAFRAAASRLIDQRMPTYLEQERGLTKERAATLSGYTQLLGVGGLFGGMLSDLVLRRTRSRRLARNGVAIGSIAASIGLYLWAWQIEDVTTATVVVSAGFFVFNFSSPCAYALCMDVSGRHLPLVFATVNTVGNLGVFVFVSAIMRMVEWRGWPFALGVWLAMHVAALVCWVFLNPARAVGESDGGG